MLVVLAVGAVLLMLVAAFPAQGAVADSDAIVNGSFNVDYKGITPALVQTLAAAIAQAEGFGKVGDIPTVRNNPGDLESGGHVVAYATPEEGWAHLYNQCADILSGQSHYYNPAMTINQIAQVYVATSDATNWANNVAAALGVTPDTTLNDWMGVWN